MMNESEWRIEVARVTRRVAELGLIRSSDGNLSARLGDDCFLLTPSGTYKATTRPDDLLLIDRQGKVLQGPPGAKPTIEWRMHLEAYRQRPDISAVVHAHPPYATALTIAGLDFPLDIIPEVAVTLGEVPTAPYATPGTEALAESILGFINRSDTILLSHHGSLSVGRTPEQALIALERVEHAAHTFFLARSLGEIKTLQTEEVSRLQEMYRASRKS